MTGAPLPPHERPWRHPSELGRAVHEPPNAHSHVIMVSTAALGLLFVALLAVAVTPGDGPSQGVVVPLEHGLALMTQPEDEPVRGGETVVGALPGGVRVTALVVAADDGLVVVSLPAAAGRAYDMAPTGGDDPSPHDTVQVHGHELATVTLAALRELDVADGTPITDADGRLIGLCVEDPASGATTMMVIDQARVDALDGSD